MNVSELIERLEQLDETAIPRFVLVQDREFVGYTIDSVANDGTLVLLSTGAVDLDAQ